MERLTRAMLRYRWPVLCAWLAVFAASVVAAAGLSDLLTNRFTLPGTDTRRTERILEAHFGQKSTGSFTLVVRGASGSANELVPGVRAAAGRTAAELPTARVVSAQPISDRVVIAQIVSDTEPAESKARVDAMRRSAGSIPRAEVLLTGQAAIEHDLDPVFTHDLKIGELYVAIPIALVLLVFAFGTLAFLMPFMFAAAAIPTTLGIVWVFANFIELTTYITNLVSLIGLGIAIDYSLLVVYRYREELRKGGSKEDAIVRTMETAGRAVVFSGSAVAVGLSLLLFMPLPFMRGFGVSLVIPAVSILCAVTLLPVLLWFLGARLDRVRLVPQRLLNRRDDEERSFWARLARTIMRRPLLFAAGSTAALLLLAAPVLALELGPGSNKGVPAHLEAVRGSR